MQAPQQSAQSEFMSRAAQESKQRNISASSALWKPMWDARKHLPSFALKNLESTRVVLLSSGHPILAHSLYRKWVSKTRSGKTFPEGAFVRCLYWTLDDQGRFIPIPGAQHCPYCKGLGRDPFFLVNYGLLDLRPWYSRKENRQYPMAVKILEASNDSVRESINTAVDVMAPQFGRQPGNPQFSVFLVSRSNNQQSLRVGDAWTFEKFASEADCQQYLSYLPDFEAGWPVLDYQTAQKLLEIHIREICLPYLMNTDRRTFSVQGAMEIFGQVPWLTNIDQGGQAQGQGQGGGSFGQIQGNQPAGGPFQDPGQNPQNPQGAPGAAFTTGGAGS